MSSDFMDLFLDNRTVAEFVITFLAILELVHVGLIRVFQPSQDADIKIEAHFQDNEDIDNE